MKSVKSIPGRTHDPQRENHTIIIEEIPCMITI